ncbi:YfbU family protein [Lactiplantibacillus pentosus]|uniref:YfbU family protein n=1 Tax=Lactiplantibacillus pentosus TaxID=1589 RepID=UPI001ADDB5F3|nr:YfbU family protein [Lactiplantibacillus pentosus]MBO9166467.1 YfbU family protein [Lactiplantibacillus pentosus]
MDIKITDVQRQILLNQYRIMRNLNVDDEYGSPEDIDKSMDILFRGLEYNYADVITTSNENKVSATISKQVIEIEDVYDACILSYFLQQESFDQDLIHKISSFGFDGNDTQHFGYYVYANWLLNNGSFPNLAKLMSKNHGHIPNIDVNNHGIGPDLDQYLVMVQRYKDILHSDSHGDNGLSVDEVKQILI